MILHRKLWAEDQTSKKMQWISIQPLYWKQDTTAKRDSKTRQQDKHSLMRYKIIDTKHLFKLYMAK